MSQFGIPTQDENLLRSLALVRMEAGPMLGLGDLHGMFPMDSLRSLKRAGNHRDGLET